jgi:hypothetical protein
MKRMSDDKTSIDVPVEGVDWFLQNLVKLAESDIGLSVVLTTTGGLVAGTIISGKRYVKKLSENVAASGSGEAFSALAQWFSEFDEAVGRHDEAGPYFIHLENARLSAGANLTPAGALWRGNLAHVTGVSLGTLN